MDIGVALRDHVKVPGGDVLHMSKSAGFLYKEHVPAVADMDFTHVWIAAGGISVNEAKTNPDMARETLFDMPLAFLKQMKPDVRITVFTSDYALEPHRSLYATIKEDFHKAVIESKRPFTSLVGVSSLYGNWFPENCFPGRILTAAMGQEEMSFPVNKVTPTPTDFVALNLVNDMHLNFSDTTVKFLNMSPQGCISTFGWAQIILQDHLKVTARGYDPERPEISYMDNPKCKYQWHQLWEVRKHWFNALRHQLISSQGVG